MSAIVHAVASLTRRLPPSRTKARLGRALALGLSRVGVDPVGATTLKDGTRIILDPRGRTESGPFWEGVYEPATISILTRLIDTYGGSCYDVGANVGLITLPLARHVRRRPGACVVAFEPVRVNYDRLSQSIALNALTSIVRGLPVALGDTDGQVPISREAGFSSTTGNACLLADGLGPGEQEVSTVDIRTLDSLVVELSLAPPDVIKLDVEGAETLFLRGAQATLRASRPLILGEFNNVLMPQFGHSFLDAFALLPEDYEAFSLGGGDTLVRVTPHPTLGDVLLVPREKVADLPFRIR